MLLSILSPAKRLRETKVVLEPSLASFEQLEPRFAKEVGTLVRVARKMKVDGLKQAMSISHDLAQLNAMRFKQFALSKTGERLNAVPAAQPAAYVFQGDVYQGLDFETLGLEQRRLAQDRLRILSGLYGLLRPFDLVQPYRLEMGTSVQTSSGSTLYAFWKDKISKALNEDAQTLGVRSIVNLASQEYWKVVKPQCLMVPIVACHFKEWRNGQLKTISFNAKRARGLMARYIIEKNVDRPDGLKDFSIEGYGFSVEHSDANNFVFTKPEAS